MGANRTPNLGLARLIAESRWGNAEFARAVNRGGTEIGLRLRYDESAVCHWLSGTMPRVSVRPVIVEVFARRLGRPVHPREAGFVSQNDGLSGGSDGDTVVGLIALGGADMDPSRRSVLGVGLYSAAFAIPGWSDMADRFSAVRRSPHMRIGPAEVDAVVTVTRHMSDIDNEIGGRSARPMAAAFLVDTIAPYLRAEASDEARRAMLTAAAEHCYLIGYMAVDERADALGQNYYARAAELAAAADDHVTYGTVLRGMSVQAIDLGHGAVAARLADAAATAAPQAEPRMLAFLRGQQAHVAAWSGDTRVALQALGDAERAMDKAEGPAKTFGAYSPSALNYHTAQVRYELDDKSASVDALDLADRVRGSGHRRSKVRFLGILAERKLELGRLDEACADWHRALDDYPHVQSGRCDDRFRAMVAALRPYLRSSHAKALHDRARTLRPVATG